MDVMTTGGRRGSLTTPLLRSPVLSGGILNARPWLLVWLLAWGCSRTAGIGDILEDPRRFDGGTVTIRGRVTGSANLAVLRGFSVRDATGEMIVVTARSVPRRGQDVTVKGRVMQALAVDGASLVVLVEEAPP